MKVEGSGNKNMYFGNFEHTMDAKGRICIPAKVREALGTVVYITKGMDGCLNLYSEKDFEKILTELSSLSFNNPQSRAHIRANAGSTDECEIDKQGRLQLPSKLLVRENLGKEITIVGAIDHLEIWDRARWNEYFDNAYSNDEQNAKDLDSLK